MKEFLEQTDNAENEYRTLHIVNAPLDNVGTQIADTLNLQDGWYVEILKLQVWPIGGTDTSPRFCCIMVYRLHHE